MLCVAFNPDVLGEVALPPCHILFQFYTTELRPLERLEWLCKNNGGEYDEWKSVTHKKMDELNVPRYALSCSFYMRSNDFCCGNPYNIAQYAMLTYMLCEVCNMVPGELIYSGGDVHVYTNHIEGAKEQLKRTGSNQVPQLKFARKITDINDFRYDDFIIENYYPDPPIKYLLNVGL
jgi:thymidylate synthase